MISSVMMMKKKMLKLKLPEKRRDSKLFKLSKLRMLPLVRRKYRPLLRPSSSSKLRSSMKKKDWIAPDAWYSVTDGTREVEKREEELTFRVGKMNDMAVVFEEIDFLNSRDVTNVETV